MVNGQVKKAKRVKGRGARVNHLEGYEIWDYNSLINR